MTCVGNGWGQRQAPWPSFTPGLRPLFSTRTSTASSPAVASAPLATAGSPRDQTFSSPCASYRKSFVESSFTTWRRISLPGPPCASSSARLSPANGSIQQATHGRPRTGASLSRPLHPQDCHRQRTARAAPRRPGDVCLSRSSAWQSAPTADHRRTPIRPSIPPSRAATSFRACPPLRSSGQRLPHEALGTSPRLLVRTGPTAPRIDPEDSVEGPLSPDHGTRSRPLPRLRPRGPSRHRRAGTDPPCPLREGSLTTLTLQYGHARPAEHPSCARRDQRHARQALCSSVLALFNLNRAARLACIALQASLQPDSRPQSTDTAGVQST